MIFENHQVTDEKFQIAKQNKPLLLIAYDGERPIGFKLGYVDSVTSFYSWLGGVHPKYRRQGIAQNLLTRQEDIVQKSAIKQISFRTYDRFPAMIELGKKNGYQLIRSEPDGDDVKHYYEKRFNSSFPKFD